MQIISSSSSGSGLRDRTSSKNRSIPFVVGVASGIGNSQAGVAGVARAVVFVPSFLELGGFVP